MASTIQTIETPKRARALDSSGNNNHGQLYSGRALEFDGVTDYFQHNGGTNITGVNTFDDGSPWTFACWMYFNSNTTTEVYFVGEDEDTKPHLLKTNDSSGVELRFREDGTGDYYKFTTGPYPPYNTWHRVVVTTNGTTMTAYINGALFGSFTKGDASTAGDGTVFSTTKMHFTGWGASYATGDPKVRGYHFDGMMSDGQVWDAAWTADDVTYDYLNPESLALNRGGTSLTESNLKMWYPMQDGHRGNQSYVLDASNTGLGDDVITDGTFPSLDNWQIINATGANQVTLDNGTAKLTYDNTVSTNALGIRQTGVLTTGVTYKITMDVVSISGDGVKLYTSGSGVSEEHETKIGTGSHSIYFTAVGPDVSIYRSTQGSASTSTVDNVVVKPVNDKNHATTVFYGDEEAVNGDFETFPTLHASNNDTFTDESVDGNQNVTMVTETGGVANSGSKSAKATLASTSGHITYNKTDYVVGRTYEASVAMRKGAGKTITGFQMHAAETIRGTATSGAALSSITESFQTASVTFTATATTMFVNMNITGASGHWAFIDDFSIKEVGVASGWTDADQQLHIPQTALQSYNELAWFDGSQRTTHDNGFTPGDNTTVAFWVFLNGPDGENKGLFNCISWNSDNFRIIVDPSNRIAVQIASSGVTTAYTNSRTIITKGKWIHVCATIPKATSSTGTIYINGEGENYTTSTTMATASRNINFLYGGGLTQEYVPGSITEMSIWNAILTQAEVKELYNDGKALDALIHSNTSNLTAYWRNNGLNTWTDLKGSDNGVINCDETMLIPQGLDNRDSQGFIMNRQRNTSSLNFPPNNDGNYRGSGMEVYNTKDNTLDGQFDSTGNGLGDFTIEFWFKTNQVLSSGSSVLYQSATYSAPNWTGLDIHLNSDGSVGASCYTDASNSVTWGNSGGSGVDYNDGNWHHVVLVVDRSTKSTLIIDKVVKDIVTGTTITDHTSIVLFKASQRVGSSTNAFQAINRTDRQAFEGQIDGFKIYKDLLTFDTDGSIAEGETITSGEVLRNYNATKGSHRN